MVDNGLVDVSSEKVLPADGRPLGVVMRGTEIRVVGAVGEGQVGGTIELDFEKSGYESVVLYDLDNENGINTLIIDYHEASWRTE